MASSDAKVKGEVDLEAQTSDASVPLPTTIELEDDPPTNPPNPQPPSSADPQLRATNTVEPLNVNPPAQQTANNSELQRDENHGDSSDGLWSLYLTESEKQDKVVIESWKGDTDGIIVFTGLFSATVATFIIESLQNLSPDSGDTTNALLTQITQQLVNISSGAPLTSISAQSGQSFKPTASAVRVNVLWFLSLILSLNCALSATLMQQWARRYQELGQRPGAFHRRGRMRAFIFDGISRFGMARAVSTMPTLLHLSVFLFLAGLVEFLFPIHPIVAYATLGCIMAFALPYAILTVLPNIHLNCPYGTPLSAMTWRISQFSAVIFLQTILGIRTSFWKMRSFAMRQAPESPGLQKWRESLENQVKMRRQWFSQGIRRSVELSAYRADSTVVTNALVWTLAALDEDKEIEDFAARIPGFFNSRVVPDATSAALSLMSHDPAIDPVFGSRLCNLLKTCTPEASVLDERMRKNRLRVSLNCLWHFGRAYNQPGVIQALPAYFPNSLIPEITRRVRTEKDSDVRVLGRCFEALMVNKLAADIYSRISPIRDAELSCLSAILGIKRRDVVNLPGAVTVANLIMFMFEGDDTSILLNTIPSDLLDVVQQTLGALSQSLSTQERAKLQLYQPVPIINGSNGNFERVLLCRLHDLLNTCIVATSLDKEVCTSCLQMCLRGLWNFERALNQIRNSMDLPSCIYIPFLNPEVTHHLRSHTDPTVRVMGNCVLALVVNVLAVDINARTLPVEDTELACLSAILRADSQGVARWLHYPGAIQFTNIVCLMDSVYDDDSWSPTSDVLDMVQQTFSIVSRSLLAQLDAMMQLDLTDHLMGVSKWSSFLTRVVHSRVTAKCLKNLWNFTRTCIERGDSIPLPSYIFIAFTQPRVSHCILEKGDIAAHVTRLCAGALVVNKLAAEINARTIPVNNAELARLSVILGTDFRGVAHWFNHPGAMQFANIVFFVSDDVYDSWSLTSDMQDLVRRTFSTISQGLPAQLDAEMRQNLTDNLMEVSNYPTTFRRTKRSSILGQFLKNMWHFTRVYTEQSVPLPSYIYITFANPVIACRILEKGDIATHVTRRYVGALVVNKLAGGFKSGLVPVNDLELACLSAILHSETHDVRLCLTRPGAVEVVNLASLVLGHADSLEASDVPRDLHEVLQQTLGILSRRVLSQEIAQIYTDQTISELGDAVVFRLHSFLKICAQGVSPLSEEVRTACLRMCLKNLWLYSKAYHRTSTPLPPYFRFMLASPEIIRSFQAEKDPVVRLTGCCFGAMISSKLMVTVESLVPLPGRGDQDGERACISAILGIRNGEDLLTPLQLRIVNFRKVVSVILDEIDTLFTDSEGRPVNILPRKLLVDTAKHTFDDLADRLCGSSKFTTMGLPMDQQQLLQGTYSDIYNAFGSYRQKHEMVKALNRLQRKLEKLLPAGLWDQESLEDE